MQSNSLKAFVTLWLIAYLSACGDAAKEKTDIRDNTVEVEAHYAEHPERFVFASAEDLPQGLVWQDGSELAVFGDSRARRGGTLNLRLRDMQQTLRLCGPDANSTLRGPRWSANSVQLIEQHPC